MPTELHRPNGRFYATNYRFNAYDIYGTEGNGAWLDSLPTYIQTQYRAEVALWREEYHNCIVMGVELPEAEKEAVYEIDEMLKERSIPFERFDRSYTQGEVTVKSAVVA